VPRPFGQTEQQTFPPLAKGSSAKGIDETIQL
jgi:hypothetical protein